MTFYKRNLSAKIFFIICVIIWYFPYSIFSNNFLDENKIKYDLQFTQRLKHVNTHQKSTITKHLQSALCFIEESKLSNNKIKEYQEIIDNFSNMAFHLQEECNVLNNDYYINTDQNLSALDLKQQLFQINIQLKNLSEQLKKEKEKIGSIHEFLILLPQQKITINNILNNLKKQKMHIKCINTPLEYAKFTEFRAKQSANRLKIIELELAHLSSSNQKELSKLRIELLTKKYNYAYKKFQTLKNQLNSLYYEKSDEIIFSSEKILLQQNQILPKSIKKQLQKNDNFSLLITQQKRYIKDIDLKKSDIDTYILQAQQTFANLIEQSPWVDKSPELGKILRIQVSRLPKVPKFQQLNNEMAQLKAQRLYYENRIHKLSMLLTHSKQDNGEDLTICQKHILEKVLNMQNKFIVLLINNYDAQIIGLTKLKLSYEQLKNSLQEAQQAAHRYLFWIADAHPLTISYILDAYYTIYKTFTDKTFHHQIVSVLFSIYDNKNILILIIICAVILFGFHFGIKNHYYAFLEESNKYIGKVNQDNFLLTFYTICIAIFMAMPIPILWIIIGYNLNHSWSFPIVIAVGDGMISTALILWVFILSLYLASDKGLFIVHFGWPKKNIQRVFSSNYVYFIIIIVFLTMALIVFNSYNNREFSNTLGRFCFILLCIHLVIITNNLKQSGFPLYLNRYDSSNNIINYFLWNIMICAPILAAIASAFGYLFAAQILLARLETSLFIWSLLLIIYYTIRRWMFIQRRRIAFKHAKKKRATQLALRTYKEELLLSQKSTQYTQLISKEKNKKNLNLDIISIKSLQLIRSVIILVALLLMTLLWSELHSAFSFLENITLWDVTSTIKGVENIQPITLKTFLTIIVVIAITTIMVRNLPAFLELTLLQHLHLTPGTEYAITTLTKYILMLLSSLIGLSLIGIEWVKIQWLIAALGVGLGFGLQEIFANFISGLMILFEKPIRIGDTITIRNVTGSVTCINTRATIITDWDHKEIIIPNKEFITKQFINWSLSDTITRVILRIPVPFKIDTKKMIYVLIEIIKNSSLALDQPAPEVYLISLNQGLPIFEIRTYTADIKSRIPLCHQINTEIINYCKKNGFQLPFLPFCYYKDSMINSNTLQASSLEVTRPMN